MAKAPYGGRWEIIASLAEGGQSKVFRVRDTSGELQEDLVLKRVLNPKRHDRFRDEVEAVKRLDHPNIIKLIDHSALNGAPESPDKQFLVMPLAANGELSTRVSLYRDNVDSVVLVAKQLAGALRAAHAAGIIHRDVKPQNILFPTVGHDVWLTDFGICLIRDRDRATEICEVVGPMQFMAPELESGGQLEVTPAADVYSLGKVLYFMLSGGVVLPRERLHEPEYVALFSRGGERQRLFQLLFGKMICPLSGRLKTMDDVLLEIDRIESWALEARLPPISPDTLAGFEAIQRRAIERQRVHDENTSARYRRGETLKVTQAGVLDWLRGELEKTAALIGQGAGLTSGVREAPDASGIPNAGDYRPGAGIELWIQSVHDQWQRQHVLRFCLCTKLLVSLRVILGPSSQEPSPAEPEHTMIGVLPAYGQLPMQRGQKSVWFLLTSENGLYQHVANGNMGSPMNRMTNRGQPVQPLQVHLIQFSTEHWPATAEHFPDFFKKAVGIFTKAISQHL